MSTGWVCPVCGKVYAPWVAECNVCGKSSVATGTDLKFDYKIPETTGETS